MSQEIIEKLERLSINLLEHHLDLEYRGVQKAIKTIKESEEKVVNFPLENQG